MKIHRTRVSGALFLLWDPKHREKRVSQTLFLLWDPKHKGKRVSQVLFPLWDPKHRKKRVSQVLFLLWDPKPWKKRVSQATFSTIAPLVISHSGFKSHKHFIIIPIFIRSVNLSVSAHGPLSVMQMFHLWFSYFRFSCRIFKCAFFFLITNVFLMLSYTFFRHDFKYFFYSFITDVFVMLFLMIFLTHFPVAFSGAFTLYENCSSTPEKYKTGGSPNVHPPCFPPVFQLFSAGLAMLASMPFFLSSSGFLFLYCSLLFLLPFSSCPTK